MKRVTNGILQERVLAPVIFVVHINYITEEVNSYTNMFADDTKILQLENQLLFLMSSPMGISVSIDINWK